MRVAEDLRAAIAAGQVCGLAGAGLLSRVERLHELAAEGSMGTPEALGIARVTAHVALGLPPLPGASRD